MAANVIFRGPSELQQQVQTITLPVAGAYLPGEFVVSDGIEFTRAAEAVANMQILTNRDFYGQGLDDAYAANDSGIAYRIAPDLNFQVRMAAATYAYNDELTVDANGRLAAASTGDIVVATFTGVPGAFTAGQLADVTIANSYAKPA